MARKKSPSTSSIRSQAQPLGQIMTKIMTRVLKKKGFANAQQAKILSQWPDIVGEHLASQSQPRRIKNRCLILYASSGAALEIQHCSPQIISQANALCGYQAILRIKIIQR